MEISIWLYATTFLCSLFIYACYVCYLLFVCAIMNKIVSINQSQSYFMCIKPLWWLISVPNMNNIHWFITYISLQTYNIYDIMDINATFWHWAKVYFTCIKSLLWLIIIPNMNKILACIFIYRGVNHMNVICNLITQDFVGLTWHVFQPSLWPFSSQPLLMLRSPMWFHIIIVAPTWLE